MKELNRKQAQNILLNAKVAIHQLKELGPDYEIWQNAINSDDYVRYSNVIENIYNKLELK